jgi:predicted permease
MRFTLPLRLRSLFRKNVVESELDEELRDHLDRLTDQNISRGMSRQEARYAALRAMDGIEQRKEQCRDTRRVRPIEDFFKDARYALRAFRRSPVFTTTAVLSLALGIGANTAIFTAVDKMLWKPLPVERPQELVRFGMVATNWRGSDFFPAAFGARLRESPDVFADVIGVSDDGLSFTYDGRAERILAGTVSPNYFSFLGVKTILGEPFSTGVREGHWAAEAVLGYRFWKNRFGGDPSAIGRVIHLNTYPFTIVGVSAPDFYDLARGLDPELRIPRMPHGQRLNEIQIISDYDQYWQTMARLKPGVTLAQASAIADTQYHEVLRAENASQEIQNRRVHALPGDRGWPQYLEEFSKPLFVLFALVGGVLLIACANVASMLLARAASRQRELAVRCSVGAGRGRLIRQMLAESVLLAGGGGLIGIAAAYWCGPLLMHFMPRSNITLAVDLRPDARSLWFTIALSILTGILFGVVPALQATRGDLAGTLKTDTGGSAGDVRSTRFRNVLVSAQVAFSLVLLIAAGLFVRTTTNLRPKDLGLDPSRVLQFMIKPQQELYNADRMRVLTKELLRRIREIPGVQSAALGHPGPYTGYNGSGWMARVPGRESVLLDIDSVTSGFIETFGLRLIAGRDFNEGDKPGSTPVAVINEKAARALFGDVNAVGRTFHVQQKGDNSGPYQVIGVIADAHYSDLHRSALPMMFATFQKFPPYMPVVHVRTSNPDTASMMTAVRRVFDEVDKGFPVFNVKTMAMQIDDNLARERLVANFAAAFGMLALLLAAVGLYGILAYSVARRTREIGIRMALGSGAGSMVWMVASEALKLVGLGCAAGIAMAAASGRLISSYLFGVSAADPLTIAAAAAVMIVVAAIAVSIPALRATRVDPLIALRYD